MKYPRLGQPSAKEGSESGHPALDWVHGSSTARFGAENPKTPPQAFEALGEAPDFDYTRQADGPRIQFVHRRLAD